LGVVILIRLMKKNSYICRIFHAQASTLVKLRFAWYISKSDFGGPKSSYILISLSSNITNY